MCAFYIHVHGVNNQSVIFTELVVNGVDDLFSRFGVTQNFNSDVGGERPACVTLTAVATATGLAYGVAFRSGQSQIGLNQGFQSLLADNYHQSGVFY